MAYLQDCVVNDTMLAYESTNSDEFVDFDSFVNFPVDETDPAFKNPAIGALGENWNSMDGCLSIDPAQRDFSFQDTAFIQSTFSESFFTHPTPISPQTSLLEYSNASCNSLEIADADLTAYDPFFDDALQWLPHVSAIKDLAHARARNDKSSASMKAKRRDAAISLYLQRQYESDMRMATDFSQHSFDEFTRAVDSIVSPTQSPQSSYESVPGLSASTSSNSPAETDAPAAPSSQPTAGGFEMVLDLNMNATTRVPRRQKPRTKEQIEDYIKVRKNGACIKHKKQHKKCNCLDKLSTEIESKLAAMIEASVKSKIQHSERVQTSTDLLSSTRDGLTYSRSSDIQLPDVNYNESKASSAISELKRGLISSRQIEREASAPERRFLYIDSNLPYPENTLYNGPLEMTSQHLGSTPIRLGTTFPQPSLSVLHPANTCERIRSTPEGVRLDWITDQSSHFSMQESPNDAYSWKFGSRAKTRPPNYRNSLLPEDSTNPANLDLTVTTSSRAHIVHTSQPVGEIRQRVQIPRSGQQDTYLKTWPTACGLPLHGICEHKRPHVADSDLRRHLEFQNKSVMIGIALKLFTQRLQTICATICALYQTIYSIIISDYFRIYKNLSLSSSALRYRLMQAQNSRSIEWLF